MRSRTFLIPGLFLFVIGMGNLLVGHFKEEQYNAVIAELSQRPTNAQAPSLTSYHRLENDEEAVARRQARTEKAKSRRELYHLFVLGGVFFLALACLAFIGAALVKFLHFSRNSQPKDSAGTVTEIGESRVF